MNTWPRELNTEGDQLLQKPRLGTPRSNTSFSQTDRTTSAYALPSRPSPAFSWSPACSGSINNARELESIVVRDRAVLVIGEFDGFHLGHARLLRQACTLGSQMGLAVSAVVLAGEWGRTEWLTAPALRCAQLLKHGAAEARVLEVSDGDPELIARTLALKVCEEFSPAIAVLACPPEQSLRYARLRTALHGLGIPVREVPRVFHRGQLIRSKDVIQSLREGDVQRCAELLGRPYTMTGMVTLGDQRGRRLGFPTANLMLTDDQVTLADGVYAAWAVLGCKQVFPAAVNIGLRPTFYSKDAIRLAEAHLLDFDGDLYGSTISLTYRARLRSERKFASIDLLRAQLLRDVSAARLALARYSAPEWDSGRSASEGGMTGG